MCLFLVRPSPGSPCSRVEASLHRAKDMMMEEARACGIPGIGASECKVLLVLLLCSGKWIGRVRGCATRGTFSIVALVVLRSQGAEVCGR